VAIGERGKMKKRKGIKQLFIKFTSLNLEIMKFLAALILTFQFALHFGQDIPGIPYWNQNTQLIPWRLPLPVNPSKIETIDLDKDGDPDVLKSLLYDSIPILWIDDDDDMKKGDYEGDTDNDCLLVDRNGDGIFAGPMDLSIDWNDEDNDGIADIQLVANNGDLENRYSFDFTADFMYFIDMEKDNIKHFINWNAIRMQAWKHNGHSDFYEDYHGNTLFLKMHASTFRIGDMRYSWENPFIFYDFDNDGLTEMAIRLVDTPEFRPENGQDEHFNGVNKDIDVLFKKKIDWVGIGLDLDNDNGQGNEFDFDMSLNFKGPGFDYSDQVHPYKSLKGLPAANRFFYDARWRQMEELIYPDQNVSWDLIFKKGKWISCQLVFDEDDDCNRWERVEFYEPKDLYIIGRNNGGIDNHNQADAMGDRGEWDMDFSGGGRLYIGAFDGRIHLYGAEWGAWRIDQAAFSFQGYGGLYDRSEFARIQTEPGKFGTVKYTDTDGNGFFDQVEYDLDGDRKLEEKINLAALGIDDRCNIISTADLKYSDFKEMFSGLTEKMWTRSMDAIQLARKQGLNPGWYAFWMQPHTLQERYDFGYWLNFYLYHDMRHLAKTRNDPAFVSKLDKAYYSGDWKSMK
jgi:hypothetical protein